MQAKKFWEKYTAGAFAVWGPLATALTPSRMAPRKSLGSFGDGNGGCPYEPLTTGACVPQFFRSSGTDMAPRNGAALWRSGG